MSLETHILEIIDGKKKAPLVKPLLHLLSLGYRAGVNLRHLAYDHLIPKSKLNIPVISIGNIVAGGTGKTPLVRYFAEEIGKQKKVAILSRGYRRSARHHLVVKKGTDPKECGDEPYWLKSKLPESEVIVGSDRIYSGYIAQVLDADVVLLDDGMQYRRLGRDLEVGILHASDLFGTGYYLPRGLLRDSPRRLGQANLLIVSGIETEEQFERLEKQIRHFSSAPIAAAHIEALNGSDFASKKVATFSAIARPQRFYKTLHQLGCEIVESIEKPDHTHFTSEELQHLSNRALDQGAELLVCTEKDAVKLDPNLSLRLPIKPLEIQLKPTFGKTYIQTLLNEVLT